VRSLVWLVFAACGGATTPTSPPHHPAGSDQLPPTASGPSERECDELIGHAVALGIDEHATRPADRRPTDADRDTVRASLGADFAPECRKLSREGYRCAIAARTLADLGACQDAPSNSTSNSKVAPGGMTAPAPRSP
jgi:hypothetical protein